MKNKYVVPEIQIRHVKIKTFLLPTTNNSDGQYKMKLNNDNPITESEEILTKERAFYEDDAFGLTDW